MPTTPAPRDLAACSACDQSILWTITARGRRQAVNPEPAAGGNTAVYRDGLGGYRSRGLTSDRPAAESYEWLAMPHAATCSPAAPPVPNVQAARRRLRLVHDSRTDRWRR
ncbi:MULTISPECIES: hypothetical protein [unclassified Streptomyces]|uniref:hypothetical protein n=1 Tax=unclassified Streptomyces TaxID=2593676 RepID=UPI002271F118|nr:MULTISPECIES: hypothetical protein [unclassified Streptomyces]MCY0921866.1 hypothetical protein [Streptomyces sp. H27-G5]MCY0957184.1 hypothetical protein [Streptomyces sp. H27-H5]